MADGLNHVRGSDNWIAVAIDRFTVSPTGLQTKVYGDQLQCE